MADPRQYLDPRTLAKISALDLRARSVIEGLISGMHRSPYRGFSVEFAEHREYVPGDDIKYIDWKVFGRSDRYYVKQYEEETNLHLVLVLDTSESMAYKSPRAEMSKYEYSVTIAASLAYLALRQADSVGLALFHDRLHKLNRPSNSPGHWRTLIDDMHQQVGTAKTRIAPVLHDLAERLHHRCLILLISDLFGDPHDTLSGLKHLHYRRHEVVVFNVMDPDELEFPFDNPTLFEGMEAAGELLTEPRALRRRYLEEVAKFTETLKKGCQGMHVDYTRVSTAEPLDVALSTYLATRSASIAR